MNQPLMLEGIVSSLPDPELERLRREVDRLKHELIAANKHNTQLQNRLAGIGNLQRQLQPLYVALKMIFGEIQQFDVEESGGSPASGGKWDVIKQRLAPRLREAVDILLLQGPMRRTQLASAMKMDYSNCIKNVVGILLRQGLMIENGKELALKNL